MHGQLIFDKDDKTIQWRMSFLTDGAGQLAIHMQKDRFVLLPGSMYKNSLKVCHRPKCKW